MADAELDRMDDVEKLDVERRLPTDLAWRIRKEWIQTMRDKDASMLIRGSHATDKERHQAEGRCQAFDHILMRDEAVVQAHREYLQETMGPDQGPEELEGGNHGVNYEAAR